MPKTVFKHVKKDIPPELLKKLQENPDEEYVVVLQPMREVMEDGDEKMPSEENIRPEFAAQVEKSSQEALEGKAKTHHCKDMKEVDALFDSWKNE
ncbi:MAG: hypothetical protein V3U37_06110 [Nitrospinaceae bacterium]